MKTFQEGADAILARRKQITDLEKEISDIKKQMIEAEFNPLHIGDIVPVTGYTHRGKSLRIERIYVGVDEGSVNYIGCGSVVNKDEDGHVGSHRSCHTRYMTESSDAS